MSDLAMKVLQWQSEGHVGISSATMASIALRMKKNFYHSRFDAPSDPSDLRRCMNLVKKIPEIREHFSVIAEVCPQFSPIIEHWDELIAMLRREMALGDRAPETYARMKQLFGEA